VATLAAWHRGLLLAGLLLPVALGAAPRHHKHKPAQAPAASTTQVEAKRGQLEELHGRIEKLHQDLLKTEETRSSASDQLKETESAISDANRGLRELGEQRGTMQNELTKLQQQSQAIENQIAAQQGQLGGLLFRQYVNGNNDALHLLLGGNDPNQAARDLHYMTLLSGAKADLIDTLHDTLTEQQRLTDAARVKRDEIAAVEKKQQQQRAALVSQQQQRQAMLSRLADKINAQRREIDTLKHDEKRLSKLIEGLDRIVAKPTRKKPATVASGKNTTAAAPEAPLRNEQEPEAMSFSGNFAALKGHLHLPTRGELANRFGGPRAESGASWKGLFIRAAEGAEVKAVAPGRVVFADWLRGFGNLLIIDHGDAYLSVYGNNQSLFRQVGDVVNSGDAVAAVGNSGGNPESGLYFELRQQGQAIDPLKWVSLR
jgi:septal ring factor EnvC (AmiA/AmiB activator)